ncbi:MAG: hypothetical protein Q9167_001231 [Letrouitia subvulpina]
MAENLPFNPQVFRTSNDRPMPITPPSTTDLTSMPLLKHSHSDPPARRAPLIPLQLTANKSRESQGNITPNQPRRRSPVPSSTPVSASFDPTRRFQQRLQQTFPWPPEIRPDRTNLANLPERRQRVPENVSSVQDPKDRSDSDATIRPPARPVKRTSTHGSGQSSEPERFPVLDVTTSIQAPPVVMTTSPPSRLDGIEEESTAPSSKNKKKDSFCKTVKKIPSKLSLLWGPRSKANDLKESPVASESGSSVPKSRNPLWSKSSKRFKRRSNQRAPLLSSDGGQKARNYGSFDQTISSSQQSSDPVSEPSSNSEQRPPPLPSRPITPQPANPFDDSSRLETFGIHPQDPATQAELDEAEYQAAVTESQQTLREARIHNLGLRSSEDTMIEYPLG